MYWECIENVLRMYWKCIENVLRMYKECIENVGHAIISASAEFHWWPTEVSHLSNFSNQSHSHKVLYAIASSQGHRGPKYLSGNSISSVMPVTRDHFYSISKQEISRNFMKLLCLYVFFYISKWLFKKRDQNFAYFLGMPCCRQWSSTHDP